MRITVSEVTSILTFFSIHVAYTVLHLYTFGCGFCCSKLCLLLISNYENFRVFGFMLYFCSSLVSYSFIILVRKSSRAAGEIREAFCNVGLINNSAPQAWFKLSCPLGEKSFCHSSFQISSDFVGRLNFTFRTIHVVQYAHPYYECYTEQLEVVLIQMYRVHRYMSLDM